MIRKTHNTRLALILSTCALFNTATTHAIDTGSTATGLDQLVDIIKTDERLPRRISAEQIDAGAEAADGMNGIIVDAIHKTGVANDSLISKADTRELNDYIFYHHSAEWVELHGDDEDGVETGFHLVQGDGARTKLFGRNAVNQVADGIYHLGFETHRKNRLMNEDGDANKSFNIIAQWLSSLLANDLSNNSLANPAIKEVVGTTATGLDQIINIIYTDPGLQKRISTGDIREGAAAVNGMNGLIVEAIRNTGVATDGVISKDDIPALNAYLVTNYADDWSELHGDDEGEVETGFHLVQGDGAKTRLYGKNALNRVADAIYHLGFETNEPNHLTNEDGDRNASFRKVAEWLNQLLANELAEGSLS